MANDLATVQSNPVEGGVWKVVDVVPAQLLGEESVHARQSAKLGDLR